MNTNLTQDYNIKFMGLCKTGNIDSLKQLLDAEKSIDISARKDYAFRTACENGHLDVCKFLLQMKPTIDISIGNDYAFRNACFGGHLEVAKWIRQISQIKELFIPISAYYYSFTWSCLNGHLDVCKWLLQENPHIDISADNNYIFKNTCKNRRLEVAKWLQSLYPEKYQITLEIPTITYKIIKTLDKSTEILYLDLDALNNCPVCDETKIQVATKCHHMYCEQCLSIWLENNTSCPYCRANLENTLFMPIFCKNK